VEGDTRHVLIATAGHVDHGKTALVRILTGIETDTLKEERERGLTIDAGFAPCELRPDLKACIVDLPGHEKLVRNLVAGAAGVDLLLLVVAADDSVMPQTVEHLRIAEFLGIERGIVALTRIDLVGDDLRDLAIEEVREILVGTPLADAPLFPVSATTGEGCEELWRGLVQVASAIRQRSAGEAFRMPVHRVFSPPGIGTVVTGMPAAGRIAVGESVELLPAGLSGRVRSIEYHGTSVVEGAVGQCLALVVSGVKAGTVARGDVLAASGRFRPHPVVDVRVRVLADAARPLEHQAPVRFHAGTALVCGRIFLLDCDRVPPGGSALARFRGDAPVVVATGDRFVLGQYSPVVTIGGGRVLGVEGARRKRFGGSAIRTLTVRETVLDDEGATVSLLLEDAGAKGIRTGEIVARSHLTPEQVRTELTVLEGRGAARLLGARDTWVTTRTLAALTSRILAAVRTCHDRHPRRLGVEVEPLKSAGEASDLVWKEAIRDLMERGEVLLERGVLRAPRHKGWLTAGQDAVACRLEQILADEGATPSKVSVLAQRTGVTAEMVRSTLCLLSERGLVVRLSDECYAHRKTERWARRLLASWLRKEGCIGVVDFRDLIGATRKYVYLWLDHFDEVGLTYRAENLRYPQDAVLGGAEPTEGPAGTPETRRNEGDSPFG
jgi:selenocysteine-specific elongation factor